MNGVNTKGSLWRIWDLQVQTILDDQYVELSSYYPELKAASPEKWDAFVTMMGGEEKALRYDSKQYFTDASEDIEMRYLNYARVLFGFLEIYKPTVGLVAFTDHNYHDPMLIDALYNYSHTAHCKCLCGVEINVSGVHMLVYFETPPFRKTTFAEGIRTFLDMLGVNTPKNEQGVLTVSTESVANAISKVEAAGGIHLFPHCNSDNGLFQERQRADRTLLSDLFNLRPAILLQCHSKEVVDKTKTYIDSRSLHFKSRYVFTISRDSRCLKDIGAEDEGGNNTWVKADCHFRGLKQVLIETDRVFVGNEPPLLTRMRNNPTKFIKSLQIKKTLASTTQDIWFDNFYVRLNAGLVAIIGNKGAGKSALTDIISLCGNTHQESANFSFLTSKKFRKVKPENLSEKFEAEIVWRDGTPSKKMLSENPDKRLPERVRYIPQNFLEKLCTEVESEDFEKEIKQIIFSHTSVEQRMGRSSLDELIHFKSSLVLDEIEKIKYAISKLNIEIIELEFKATDNYKTEVENAILLKENELAAHEKIKPIAPLQVGEETSSELVQKITALRRQIETVEHELEVTKSLLGAAIIQQEEVGQAVQYFTNLKAQLDKVGESAAAITLQKHAVPLSQVFAFEVNVLPVSELQTQLALQIQSFNNELNVETENGKAHTLLQLGRELVGLQEQLDKPAKEQQNYLNEMKQWEAHKKQIEGSATVEGSLTYLVNHLKYLIENLQPAIEQKYDERNQLIQQLFAKKIELVNFRKELFRPVSDFIATFEELKERYDVKLNVSLEYYNFLDKFFVFINQGRVGSFSGKEEGYKRMSDLLEKSHFDSQEGFIEFSREILRHLKFDQRSAEAEPVDINTQLKKGVELSQLYDFIFHFDYLQPVYNLNLGTKTLLELSPGERGALLLIFYLLLDKDDIPLLIDQPEENLDNESVYRILVHFIKRVKDKRQIIIVTHNPNLAVVCDAEQIVHINIEKENKNKVVFQSGSIENTFINHSAVTILEGTLPAFNNRDLKYIRNNDSMRIPGQPVASVPA